MKLITLIFLSVASAHANDAVGDRERNSIIPEKIYEMPTDENGRPRVQCKNKESMLDSFGCLQADSKLAKHCFVVENFRPLAVDIPSPCPKNTDTKYLCYDYAICIEKESYKNLDQPKPKTTIKDNSTT